jgi:1,4-alpha-glucan branching enzyme
MSKTAAARTQPDGTGLIELDPLLKPYAQALRRRFSRYQQFKQRIGEEGDLLGPISQGHHYFGFNRGERAGQPGIWYREWAPAAHQLNLIGDFNNWDPTAHPMERDDFGIWHLFLPDADEGQRLTHQSKVKVRVTSAMGEVDRIPAYIRRAVQEPDLNFTGQFWDPPEPYHWQWPQPALKTGMRVYEAHVGMAVEEPRVGTFREFTDFMLPRIAELGYNTVQLMAVQEHPYYGSFGYHVSNFFAPSSRFGTPEELKELVDTAHSLGLMVIMDLVHSHAVKNINEGLNYFDGTEHQYFHAGTRGEHTAWDSKCFDYSKWEVQRFLLSNVRYWLEEFNFDGFRFDGITSMLYKDHGLERVFTSYDDYFGDNVDLDAVGYLMLANELSHTLKPEARCVAEDMSGMPGLARPVVEGGLGFDYRLAMGVPDYWIKVLKHRKDENWDLRELWHQLLDRRSHEKHIGYAESHDQALVGDKTIAFWLMDQAMYWHMSVFDQSVVIDRGLALHKLIRLITFALAGEGYLTFMGNEFGHPEWIDFPREGNNFSYHYARRQWSLASRDDLRYKGLQNFDQAMQQIDADHHILEDPLIENLALHQEQLQLVFRRGPLVFVFNFHPSASYEGMRIPVPEACDYKLLVNSDAKPFEGHGLVDEDMVYPKQDVSMYGWNQSIQLYLPCRTAQVLMPVH